MGYTEKKQQRARAARGDRRAEGEGVNINSENISKDKDAINLDEYKKYTLREMRMLNARGASGREKDVYCVLTHYGKPLDGDQCHVSAEKIAEVLEVSAASVRRAEVGLVRKGIIERVQNANKGHVAVFRVRAEAFEPLTPTEAKRNDMVTQTVPKRNDVDT